jgi:cysteine-rich repeat protein
MCSGLPALVAASVLLAGCIEPQLVDCGNGLACPPGTACDLAHDTCVDPEQLTACTGAVDQTPCQTSGFANGVCFDEVCVEAGCGNGFVETAELCDDGNNLSGDGCRSDCVSAERCGDGNSDPLRGEQCDDENDRGHDGCTAACALEDSMWRLIGVLPDGRRDAGAVFQTHRNSTLTFGGQVDSDALDDTWSFDSVWWKYPGSAPPPRSQQAMAYDPDRRRTVVFGGLNFGVGVLNDTWEFTGTIWERRRPVVSPSARFGASLVWDGSSLVLFGGSQLIAAFDETWRWDGTAWTQLVTTTTPPPRSVAAVAFDSLRRRVILFGGADASNAARTDTWVFDGSDWSELMTPSDPVLTGSKLAYDVGRDRMVLVGLDASAKHRTYELVDDAWVMRVGALEPDLARAPLVYDPIRGRVLQLGGEDPTTGALRSTIWQWDGATWSVLAPNAQPAPRSECAIASDPVRGRVVMFGGRHLTNGPLGDTWEWTGTSWQAIAVSSAPAVRAGASLAYDAATGEVMMIGGATDADAWSWNGTRWYQHPTAPTLRRYAAIASEVRRQRILVFGGLGPSGDPLADTWEWDGVSWQQLVPPTSPPARSQAQMAYDIERDRIVLFGGTSATTAYDDTWEWDGSTWIERTPQSKPEPRFGHVMYYDRARRRITTLGGVISGPSMWEWDGTAWTQASPVGAPFAVSSPCAAYDDARGFAISMGGSFLFATFDRSYAISYEGLVEESCLPGDDADGDGRAGCDDDDCLRICSPTCWTTPC